MKTSPPKKHVLAKLPPRPIPLAGRHRLAIDKTPAGHLLRLLAGDGQVCLSIEVTPAGPILRFEGTALRLQAAGELAIDADRIALHARHGLKISSGGDATIAVAGDLLSQARIQTIQATRGNVNLTANDDVKMVGERILMNC